MISQDKLIRYASNFLNWEITEIEQLKALKRDAEEIEREM